MTEQTRATAAVVEFITSARWQDFPPEAIALGKRCIIDGLGVVLAGSTTAGSKIIHNYVKGEGGQGEGGRGQGEAGVAAATGRGCSSSTRMTGPVTSTSPGSHR